MSGKFAIKKAKDGQFFFNLKAGNGEIVGTSEMYKAKSSAENGIESVKKNAANEARFETFEGKNGQWYFRRKAGNGEPILASQGYSSESGAKDGCGAVARAADGAATADNSGA